MIIIPSLPVKPMQRHRAIKCQNKKYIIKTKEDRRGNTTLILTDGSLSHNGAWVSKQLLI